MTYIFTIFPMRLSPTPWGGERRMAHTHTHNEALPHTVGGRETDGEQMAHHTDGQMADHAAYETDVYSPPLLIHY